MYTDEDLDHAIKKGIFTAVSVTEFRTQFSTERNTPSVDEESFRLITGFNDIFVVIACSLLLFSSWWVLRGVNENLALLTFSVLAWGLAEFFVLKRKMALPAIVLLLSFVGGVFVLGINIFKSLAEISLIVAAGLSAIAAYFHWRRFNVPITVAAGTAAIIGLLVTSVLTAFPVAENWILMVLFICGVMAFTFAMYWDASDRTRTTQRSDVAFWLHLLSAPLIIHPVFSNLGILDGNESLISMAIVLILYLLMTLISVAIDRRAFMVSSLVYVLYALSTLLQVYGVVGYSFAITGVLIGAALLLLSAFWQTARAKLVKLLPATTQMYLPEIKPSLKI